MPLAELNKLGRRRSPFGRAFGFTLVELLVVIGIIALLISLLLPALGKARQASQRTACAAKLHEIMIAAASHAVEHKGYYPLVGQLNYGTGSSGAYPSTYMTPAGLNDAYTSRYTYMGFQPLSGPENGDTRTLAPITLALGAEMGFGRDLLNNTDATESYAGSDNLGVIRHFLCPSQASTLQELVQQTQQPACWIYVGQLPNGELIGYGQEMSYIFNEAVLGYDDYFGRLHGEAARIKQPARTMFAADGLAGSPLTRPNGGWTALNFGPSAPPPPYPMLTLWNNHQATAPITLSDALTGRQGGNPTLKLAGDAQNFDYARHQNKMNIAFCDGHVETRDMPIITANTNAKGIVTDPAARAFMDVYLLAP